MAGIADGMGLNGMQSAGLALSNFADALAMMQNRPHGYAQNNLAALQQLQRQMLMTQAIKKQQGQDSAVAGIAGGYDPTTGITWNSGRQDPGLATSQQVMTDPGQAGIAAQPPTDGGQDGAPAVPATPATFATQPVDAATQASRTATSSQGAMDTLKRAFPEEYAKATMANAMAPPTLTAIGRGGLAVTDRGGNLIKTIAAQPGTNPADDQFINLVRTDQPGAKAQAYSKTSAAALLKTGNYALAGDISMKPDERVTAKDMTAADVAAAGLPVGTIAQRKSNGELEIKSKPTGQDYFQAMPEGLTGQDAYDWVSKNLPGGNEIAALASQVEQGKKLPPPLGRPGSIGEKVNGLLALAVPGYDLADIKKRYQLNQELTDLSDKAAGGKAASVNKIINHAADVIPLAIDLKNNSILGNAGNAVANAVVGVGTGGAMKTNLRSFGDVVGKLGSESAKLAGGGAASDAARAEIEKNYNANDDLSGTIGAVGGTLEWAKGQLQPIVDRYNQTFGTHKDITDPLFMSAASAAKMKILEDTLARSKGGLPVDRASLKSQLEQLNSNGVVAATPAAPGSAPAAAATTPNVVIQNGWRYDAKTHAPLGPAQ